MNRFGIRFLMLALLIGASVHCAAQPKEVEQKPAKPVRANTAAPVHQKMRALHSRRDPGSRFEARVEAWRAKQPQRPQTVKPFSPTFKATAVQKTADEQFVALQHTGTHTWSWSSRYRVRGSVHGVVASANRGEVIIRFARRVKASDKLKLVVHDVVDKQPVRGEFALVDLHKVRQKDPSLATRFYSAYRNAFGSLRSGFIDGRLALVAESWKPKTKKGRKKGLPRATWPGARLRRRRSDIARTMELYSGFSSVREALQWDRGIRMRREYRKRATLPIAKIAGVPLPKHPWDKMIAELGKKGRQSRGDRLSQFIPHNMAYFYAHDLRTLVRLMADLDQHFAGLAQTLENRGGELHFVKRYEQQLAIRRSVLSEKLGHIAADGVALVTSDPFLREGSDVTLAFMLGNETMIRAALAQYAAEAVKRRPDAKQSSYRLAGHSVDLISTPDGAIHRHVVTLGKLLLVSNSRGALKRFIAVKQGKVSPLAKAGEYRYMRALYPFSKKTEDAYAFISDTFVAHAVSPRTKITESRRLEARADLQAINGAVLLYRLLEGKAPKSLAELVKASYLSKKELRHADGSKISFKPDYGAHSRWGYPYALTPIIDLNITRVTKEEKKAYEDFRRGYQRYWRAFIDPIAIRIKRGANGQSFDIDARMLPLIERSDYDDLIEMAGQAKMLTPDLDHGFQFAFAVGKDAKLRGRVDGLARSFGNDKLRIGWLGDWVSVGMADRGGLYDLALTLTNSLPPGLRKRGLLSYIIAITESPLYAEAHIASRFGLAATLTALNAMVDKSAPGVVKWTKGKPYRKTPVTKIVVTEKDINVTLYYAITKDVFITSFDRATLEDRIDVHLERRRASKPMQATLRVRPWREPTKSWLFKAVHLTERYTIRGVVRALDGVALLHAAGIPWNGGKGIDAVYARTYLGFVPGSTHGGTLSVDADGIASHSIFGSTHVPMSNASALARLKASPLRKVIEAIRDVALALSFEGKGNHRGLHATASWRRAP